MTTEEIITETRIELERHPEQTYDILVRLYKHIPLKCWRFTLGVADETQD